MYVSGSVRFSFGTIRTNVRNFFLIFLCNCKIKFYICITKTSLSYGVMVTQQILVLLFLVRIQVAQHRKPAAFRLRVFRFQPSAPPLPHLNAGLPARRSPPVKEPPRFPRRVPSCKGAARVPAKKATGLTAQTSRPNRPCTSLDRHTQIERQATLSLYPIRPDIGPSRSADRSPAPLPIDKSMSAETGRRTGKKEQKNRGLVYFLFTK